MYERDTSLRQHSLNIQTINKPGTIPDGSGVRGKQIISRWESGLKSS